MLKEIKGIIIFFVKIIASLFFKKKYLSGKHFKRGGSGWVWVARGIWRQRVLGFNRFIPWPMSHTSTISNWKNITFDQDDLNNFQSPGCYFQNFSGKIILGKGTYIAPNVGLITANHELSNLENHSIGKDIVLGENCWIGMNVVILPGVFLGNNVTVGAGSVVTKSFRENNIIIAGVPAKIIKKIKQ
tara:strand:+ start:132 stop:692 length:561 start_codon:yes stop_codon:yes gene_type:complete